MSWQRKRRGTTIVECTVAFVILTAALFSVAQMIAAVTVQQRAATQRQLARQEAANVMERLYALPDQDLKTHRIDESELSEVASRRLPGVEATATVTERDVPGAGKRIAVEIRWTNKAGRPARPVRLVAWRFDREVTR